MSWEKIVSEMPVGKLPATEKRAVLEQLPQGEDEWRIVAYENPTPEQAAALEAGEMSGTDLPVKFFGCKHKAAEVFSRMCGEMASNYLLGGATPPPVTAFRIREIED